MKIDGENSIKFIDIVLQFYFSEAQCKDEDQAVVIASEARRSLAAQQIAASLCSLQ